MIIWKCTRWFTVEWSLLLANSATTPVQQLVSSRDTCSPTRERSLLFAHSAATPPQQLVTSRRICLPIQEKSLLYAQSVIIAAQQLAASKHTCFHSGEKPFSCTQCELCVSSAASLTVAPVVWSIPPGWPPRQPPCPAPHHLFLITFTTITTSTRTKPSLTSFTNSLLTYSATLVTSSSTNSTTTSMTTSNLILLTLQR